MKQSLSCPCISSLTTKFWSIKFFCGTLGCVIQKYIKISGKSNKKFELNDLQVEYENEKSVKM